MNNIIETRKYILNSIPVLDVEKRDTFNCAGQVLAEDIYSEVDLPITACAAQDGYAVMAIDTANAGKHNPVNLRVIEAVRAGSVPENPVVPGTAIRVMTGSVLPDGADCIVRFEDTDEPEYKREPNKKNPSNVRILIAGKSGDNIRKTGASIKAGTPVVSKGTVIGPNHISVLMATGIPVINVVRRPVLAVISTGDELVTSGRPLSPYKTYNCNTSAIGAMVKHYGGTAMILGIARDYETSILAKIRRGLTADVIITSGGLAKGDYDLVRSVIEEIGRIKMSGVDMAPGASFTYGTINNRKNIPPVPIFALSGHPSGCMVNFELFVKPAILKMRGLDGMCGSVIMAIAEDPVISERQVDLVRWSVLKKENGVDMVSLNDHHDGGFLSSIAGANSLTFIPGGTKVRKGDTVKVYPLDWCREYKPGL